MRRPGRSWSLGLVATALVVTACGIEADDTTVDPPEQAPEGGEPAEDDLEDDATDDEVATESDGEPITIGFLGELTGNFALFGVPARNGMRMAVDDINAEGGVDGRPLELVERDTQGTPEEAVTAFEGMIDRNGIVAAGGIISSDVALSAARVAEEDGVPLFLVKAGSEAILTRDSRYTFRTCLPAAPMNMQPIAEFIEEEGLERVGAIVADYAWGRAIEAAMEDQIGALDVELQIEVAPVPETDFTTYLRQLAGIEPDIIIATGHPPGSGPITRQAAELGSEAFVTGPNSPLATVVNGVGDAVFDRYVDFSCVDYAGEEYQELASRYYDAVGDFMEDDAVAGYGQVTMIAEAIRATGSDDPADIAAYLHANRFELPGYAFAMEWTEWGEFAAAQPLLVVVREQEPPEGVNPGANWYPEVLFRSEVLEPYEP
jgi:branched-chain amino acid transport system substrate-binding protein